MVEELRTASNKVGLEINLSKTKVMFNRNVEIQPIMTGNVALDQVDRYTYLGQLISIHRDWEPEVRRRVALGKTSRYMDSSCTKKYYDSNKAEYITLKGQVSQEKPEITGSISQAVTDIKYPSENSVSENDKSVTIKCPYHGEYIAKNSFIRNSINPGCNTSYMSIGCQSENSMEIHAKCPSSTHKDRFYCHGNWTINQVHYVMASHMDSKDHYCFTYKENEDGLYFKKQSCSDESNPALRGDNYKILFHKKGNVTINLADSVAAFYGFLLKTDKSKDFSHLTKGITDAVPPPDHATLNIEDGNATFYCMRDDPTSFKQIGEKLLDRAQEGNRKWL
ncbi:hypothetical protein GQR58_024821 [Nymphon striatum]|nr:hypothetical protein GQR58_024821 [Nymphon striatum]